MRELKSELCDYAKKIALSESMVDESHFYDFRQNIFGGKMKPEFIKMFMDGDGNELVSKACAVHSSSMLGYNFFHWISEEQPFTYEGIQYTKVLFEVKIRVLKKSRKPANMDIVLTNDNGDILFIESKFLEYLHSKSFSILNSYKEIESYYCSGEKWSIFIKNYNAQKKGQYWDGIKQEICHLIGLTNWANGMTTIDGLSSYNDAKDYKFINLVFEPHKNYKEEHESFENYHKLYLDLHTNLKKEKLIPEKIKMEFKSYSDLWTDIQNCISSELKDYLHAHYMQFAQLIPDFQGFMI